MMMNVLEVGKVMPKFIGQSDGTVFDISDAGGLILVKMRNPREEEIKNHTVGDVQIRAALMGPVIMMTAKFGSEEWCDMPYTPHLSRNLCYLPTVHDGEGMGITVVVVDTASGKICGIRFISMTTAFTKALYKMVREVAAQPFDILKHDMFIDALFARYSSKQMAEMSTVRFNSLETETDENSSDHFFTWGPIPENVPEEIASWYDYVPDSGHCIYIVPKDLWESRVYGDDIEGYLCACPVKTVLKTGYELYKGYVICDLPYDDTFGLVADDDDCEY